MTMTRFARAAVTATVASVGVAACTPGTTPAPGSTSALTSSASSGPATSAGTGPPRVPMADGVERSIDPRGRRTDLEPLTSRFAAIGRPEKVVWYSGTIGSGRVPGPSAYWIDAVVTLDEATAARLRQRAGTLQPAEVDVVEQLRPDLPAGPFTGSAALDAALVAERFTSRAALAADGRTLVLRATGE